MEGRKVLDGNVERKGKYSYLVEERKWEGKKWKEKNDIWPTNFLSLQIGEKMNKTKFVEV